MRAAAAVGEALFTVTAPLVLPGATDTATFQSYVEQVLAPQLKPGDVVIWDNLQPHKAESVVRAGACLKQRDRFGDRSILDGFPARLVGTLTGPPPVPGWVLPPDAVATLRRVR